MIIPFFGFCKIAKKIVGVLGQIAHTTQYLISHMIGHQKSQHHPTISTNSFIIKRLYQRFKIYIYIYIKKANGCQCFCVFLCFASTLRCFVAPLVCICTNSISFIHAITIIHIHSYAFLFSCIYHTYCFGTYPHIKSTTLG